MLHYRAKLEAPAHENWKPDTTLFIAMIAILIIIPGVSADPVLEGTVNETITEQTAMAANPVIGPDDTIAAPAATNDNITADGRHYSTNTTFAAGNSTAAKDLQGLGSPFIFSEEFVSPPPL
jgi:hypothetical protein